MNDSIHTQQIARAILLCFDRIDDRSTELLESCLKDFGIHLELCETQGQACQTTPRRLTFVRESPGPHHENLFQDTRSLISASAYRTGDNNSAEVADCDGFEATISPRTTPFSLSDFLSTSSSNQLDKDSQSLDRLFNSDIPAMTHEIQQFSDERWPIMTTPLGIGPNQLGQASGIQEPLLSAEHAVSDELSDTWANFLTKDVDHSQQDHISDHYQPNLLRTPTSMPRSEFSDYPRRQMSETRQSRPNSRRISHPEQTTLLTDFSGYLNENRPWPEVQYVARNLVRPDLVEYVRDSLPRWSRHGIWQPLLKNSFTLRGDGSVKLMAIYSYLCKLEANMHDDQIRMRMVLIELHKCYEEASKSWKTTRVGSKRTKSTLKRGRGEASSVIDEILIQLHGSARDEKTKARLRAQFHNKKRFGKRWQLLVEGLGSGVILACSEKLSSAIHSTTFTTAMLHQLIDYAKSEAPSQLRMIETLDSATELLFSNQHNQLDQSTLLLCLQDTENVISEL